MYQQLNTMPLSPMRLNAARFETLPAGCPELKRWALVRDRLALPISSPAPGSGVPATLLLCCGAPSCQVLHTDDTSSLSYTFSIVGENSPEMRGGGSRLIEAHPG